LPFVVGFLSLVVDVVCCCEKKERKERSKRRTNVRKTENGRFVVDPFIYRAVSETALPQEDEKTKRKKEEKISGRSFAILAQKDWISFDSIRFESKWTQLGTDAQTSHLT